VRVGSRALLPQEPRYFATPADWRAWLSKHHADTGELWVGFYKRSSGKPSITWPEAVDEALCFGWIDGVRKRLDDESYVIRFTPRRRGSVWSAVNVRRIAELTKLGRMRQSGLRAYAERQAHKTAIYSFEQRRELSLPAAFEREMRADADAWRFFSAQAPWYQRTVTWWIVSAKREDTRRKRFARLLAVSVRGQRLDMMSPGKKEITKGTEKRSRTRKQHEK
jgi:uncharacterized protein YdeI (YjbR/CyaY-like superfamily)